MFTLAINDVVGLKDAMSEETTRRRFDRRLDEWNARTELRSIPIPVEYGLALLSEALTLNAESQFPLPRDFLIRRSLLGELPPPPTDALIHQHVSRGQTFLLPNLLEEAPRLLESGPELRTWIFGYGEVQKYAREYRTAAESVLVLTSEPREQRQARILGEAIDALVRRAVRRRLEETAYIFWQAGRERAAAGGRGGVRHQGRRLAPFTSAAPGNRRAQHRAGDRGGSVGLPPPPGANRTAYTPI